MSFGVPQFSDHTRAVAHLRRLAAAPGVLQTFRALVKQSTSHVRPLSDEEVLVELAWLLVRGRLFLGASPGGMAGGTQGGEMSGAAASTAETEPAAAETPPQTTGATAPMHEQEPDPEDEEILPENCDEEAQAATMVAASESGAPRSGRRRR